MTAQLEDWPQVFAFARALPGAEEGVYYGHPAVKAASNGRVFVTASREAGSFVLHIDRDHKAMLLDIDPDRFWQTPHFANWPALLVKYGRHEDALVSDWIARALELAAARPAARSRKQ